MTTTKRPMGLRPIFLFGIMIVAGGALMWRWWEQRQLVLQNAVRKDAEQHAELQKQLASDRRYEIDADPLSDAWLADTRSAETQIAALRTQHKRESNFPRLLVPTSLNRQTRKKIQAEYLAYRLGELEEYRRLTVDTGETKIAGEAFLDAYLHHMAEREDASEDHSRLHQLADVLQAQGGSRDALLRFYLASLSWQKDGDIAVARRAFTEAVVELREQQYSNCIAVSARLLLRDLEQDPAKREQRWREAIPTIIAWLEDEAGKNELRSVCERLERIWKFETPEHRRWLVVGCLSSRQIDPYLVHALAGRHYVDVAWEKRTGQWANKVSAAEWAGFHKYLPRARSHLQYAWMLHPELPYAPQEMIRVAMAGAADDDAYFWFLRTIEARFDAYDAYDAMSTALLSRWGGSRAQLLAFGLNCLETLSFDTSVPYHLIDVLNRLKHFELNEGEVLAEIPQARAALQRFMKLREEYRASRPEHGAMYEDSGRYHAEIFQALQDCGLPTEANDFLRSRNGALNWAVLRWKNRPATYLAALDFVSNNALAEQFRILDSQLRAPISPQESIAELDRLEQQCQVLRSAMTGETHFGESHSDFFEHARMILSQRRQFATNEWCSLEVTPKLAGWEPYADEWFHGNDGSIILSGRRGFIWQLCLRPLANFRPPLEVEVDVEPLNPAPFPKPVGIGWTREGMKWGYDQNYGQGLPVFGIEAKISERTTGQRADQARALLGGNNRNWFYELKSVETHRLRLRLWPDYVEFRADDGWIMQPYSGVLDPQGWLCFGDIAPAYERPNDLGAVRFARMRVRHLRATTPPLADHPLAKRDAYWDARVTRDPEDILALTQLAAIRAEQHRDDEVLALTQRIAEVAPRATQQARWEAMIRMRQRDYAGAAAAFERAHKAPGADYEMYIRHALLLAAAPDPALRNGKLAATYAQWAIGQIGARAWEARAAGLAEAGDFDGAINAQQEAITTAVGPVSAQAVVILEEYRAKRPRRLSPREPSDQ